MAIRKRVDSWVVTDDFWERVEPLIPVRERPASKEYLRKPGAGRPAKPARQVFEAVVYVLRTGCQWKAFRRNLFAAALTAALAGCGAMPPASESSIVNFHAIDNGGIIYRSGQPATEADWAALKRMGIRTVIKLNRYVGSDDTLQSEQGLAGQQSIQVVPHLMQPEDLPMNWDLGAEPDIGEVKAAAGLLANAKEPVLLHCTHGKDRTGLVVAVYRVEKQNWCKRTAYAEMLTYGHSPLLTGIKRVLDSPQIVESRNCK